MRCGGKHNHLLEIWSGYGARLESSSLPLQASVRFLTEPQQERGASSTPSKSLLFCFKSPCFIPTEEAKSLQSPFSFLMTGSWHAGGCIFFDLLPSLYLCYPLPPCTWHFCVSLVLIKHCINVLLKNIQILSP